MRHEADVSEDHAVTLVSYHITTRPQNLEDHNLLFVFERSSIIPRALHPLLIKWDRIIKHYQSLSTERKGKETREEKRREEKRREEKRREETRRGEGRGGEGREEKRREEKRREEKRREEKRREEKRREEKRREETRRDETRRDETRREERIHNICKFWCQHNYRQNIDRTTYSNFLGTLHSTFHINDHNSCEYRGLHGSDVSTRSLLGCILQ
jgi:hypothetical protein